MRAPEGDRRELDLAAGGEQEPPLITPSACGPSVCHECERLGRSRKASESVETDEVQERTSRLLDLDEGSRRRHLRIQVGAGAQRLEHPDPRLAGGCAGRGHTPGGGFWALRPP